MEWILITILLGLVAALFYRVGELEKDVQALQDKTRYTL